MCSEYESNICQYLIDTRAEVKKLMLNNQTKGDQKWLQKTKERTSLIRSFIINISFFGHEVNSSPKNWHCFFKRAVISGYKVILNNDFYAFSLVKVANVGGCSARYWLGTLRLTWNDTQKLATPSDIYK